MDQQLSSLHKLPLDIDQFHEQFATHRENIGLLDQESDGEEVEDAPEEDRPVTPIELAVKKAPKSIQELKDLIRERLTVTDDVPTVSEHDQQQLASILMSELSGVWPDMRNQAPDPFLSAMDNKELERRVTVKVVTTIEDLFSKYTGKLREANLKGVFSSVSNLSRLKTQLAFEANKCLNILSIRMNLATALRNPPKDDDRKSEDSFVIKVRQRLSQREKGSTVGRISRRLQMTRLHAEELYRRFELQEIDENIPDLDMKRILATIPSSKIYPTQDQDAKKPKESGFEGRQPLEVVTEDEERFSDGAEDFPFRLQKSHSVPQIETAELFLEELELTAKDVQPGRKTSIERLPIPTDDDGTITKEQSMQAKSPREDLEELMTKERKSNQVDEKFAVEAPDEGVPPLLQALPKSQKDKRKDRKGAKRNAETSDVSETESVASTISTIKAINPSFEEDQSKNDLPVQPAVVSRKLPNKTVMRTSDVRVSSRVQASQVKLKKHLPLYNNFKGEPLGRHDTPLLEELFL